MTPAASSHKLSDSPATAPVPTAAWASGRFSPSAAESSRATLPQKAPVSQASASSIPTTSVVAGNGPWLSCALQWSHGGQGLEGPLKNYEAPESLSAAVVFDRRRLIGAEFERLGYSITENKTAHPDADRCTIKDLASRIRSNNCTRRILESVAVKKEAVAAAAAKAT